ncbi:aldehyde dehydrogenase family protein [Ensifer sp. ENS05]|nr:aldehyde dehydrogenase family protein [Ensifer sp. ENS05]
MRLEEILAAQRRAFLADGYPSMETRTERINRAIKMLLKHAERIVEAYEHDFSGRSRFSSKTGDILGSIEAFEYTKQNLCDWMKAVPIELPPGAAGIGTTAAVCPSPLGVIGAMVPWNGPVLMACLAMAGAFGAGNRIMIKVSEYTPRTARAMAEAVTEFFPIEEAYIVEGEADVAAAFSRLHFDHLVFTGSTETGKKVMKAAAENLVPVTLELGGKCPVIIGTSADLKVAAKRILTGKLSSAGQVCVAPDYLYLPAGKTEEFISLALDTVSELYPDLIANEEYTSIITQAHRDRLLSLLEDAVGKGAKLVQFPVASEATTANGKRLPFVAVTNVTRDMKIMQEEIFGPILPVLEYENIIEPLAYIEQNPHPLAASYFGSDVAEQEQVIARIQSGAVLLNDVRVHIFFEALPFGGVGNSGIGRYRGREGFRTFSNLKTVFRQSDNEEVLARQRPPHGAQSHAAVDERMIKLRTEWLG